MTYLDEVIDDIFSGEVDNRLANEEYIGVRLSGGIDSAFLCYLTMTKYSDKKIVPLTMYNRCRPGAKVKVDKLLKILKDLNPNTTFLEQEVGWFDSTGFVVTEEMKQKYKETFEKTGVKEKYNPKDIEAKKFFRNCIAKYNGKMKSVLSGETMNPPVEEQDSLVPPGEFNPDRNVKVKSLVGKYNITPFRNRNKKHIAAMVRGTGMFDILFEHTETCETETKRYPELAEQLGKTYKEPGVEPCRWCWPCREKWWAYGVYDMMYKDD